MSFFYHDSFLETSILLISISADQAFIQVVLLMSIIEQRFSFRKL